MLLNTFYILINNINGTPLQQQRRKDKATIDQAAGDPE